MKLERKSDRMAFCDFVKELREQNNLTQVHYSTESEEEQWQKSFYYSAKKNRRSIQMCSNQSGR